SFQVGNVLHVGDDLFQGRGQGVFVRFAHDLAEVARDLQDKIQLFRIVQTGGSQFGAKLQDAAADAGVNEAVDHADPVAFRLDIHVLDLGGTENVFELGLVDDNLADRRVFLAHDDGLAADLVDDAVKAAHAGF